jgi:hypothetical protein
MNIAHKLCVPPLQTQCMDFLLTHAAGRPIKAMRIAELFDEEELYREASRFVLDNPGGWTEEEMCTLSRETQLKLEKRRVSRIASCCLCSYEGTDERGSSSACLSLVSRRSRRSTNVWVHTSVGI